MSGIKAWENDAVNHPDELASVRYEWKPNIEENTNPDEPPVYLDSGQLVMRKWDIILDNWGTPVHVAYCDIGDVEETLPTGFVEAEA